MYPTTYRSRTPSKAIPAAPVSGPAVKSSSGADHAPETVQEEKSAATAGGAGSAGALVSSGGAVSAGGFIAGGSVASAPQPTDSRQRRIRAPAAATGWASKRLMRNRVARSSEKVTRTGYGFGWA